MKVAKWAGFGLMCLLMTGCAETAETCAWRALFQQVLDLLATLGGA